LVKENLGKTLGHYVTAWGALPLRLVVIDEVSARDAQFLRLGRLREQVVPVSFYGTSGGLIPAGINPAARASLGDPHDA
jgi:ethanolamine utilization protein EutA